MKQQSQQTKSAIFGKLNTSRERSQMMMANSKTLSNDLYDPETGQALFQPKVGRAPNQLRPKAGAGTSEHLYKAAQLSSYKKMSAAVQDDIKRNQNSNMVFTCVSTKKMVDDRKFAAFQHIFDFLDSDKDGHISAEKIDTMGLSSELFEIL